MPILPAFRPGNPRVAVNVFRQSSSLWPLGGDQLFFVEAVFIQELFYAPIVTPLDIERIKCCFSRKRQTKNNTFDKNL